MLRTRPNTIIRGEVQGEYVVRGAKIKCSKALKDDAYDVVNLPLCHGVYSGDEPLINIKDMKDGENIVNGFGVCSETGTACKGEMKFHINWINRKKIRLHIEGEQAVTTNSFTMCSAHGGEITFENSGQTAVYHPKNERARDEALELQGTASYLTENNSQDMVSLSNDTKHVSFGVMGTTYDSSENYVQYSDESKKEELRPKLTEAEKAINQKNVLEALQTKDVNYVKELLARRELISPDGSPYAYYKVATRQGVEYIVLFTEEQHNQGLAAGAVGVVAVASLGGAAVLATCTVEQLAVGATAYTTRLVTAPDFANDITTFEMSMADGDKVGMTIDGIFAIMPDVSGGAGTVKNITEDTLEAVVKDSTSYLDDAADVVKKSDEVIEETVEEVAEKGGKEVVEGTSEVGFKYNMVENPGPLADIPGNPASNFAGGKYNTAVLDEDMILYRAGKSGGGKNSLGQWFTETPAESVINVRIDTAVKPQWIDPKTGVLTGTSPLQSNYAIKIPAGTTIYKGPVGYQGDIYQGGQDVMQIFVEKPWLINGIETLSETPLP